jgi:hypothetical protein
MFAEAAADFGRTQMRDFSELSGMPRPEGVMNKENDHYESHVEHVFSLPALNLG